MERGRECQFAQHNDSSVSSGEGGGRGKNERKLILILIADTSLTCVAGFHREGKEEKQARVTRSGNLLRPAMQATCNISDIVDMSEKVCKSVKRTNNITFLINILTSGKTAKNTHNVILDKNPSIVPLKNSE